MSSRAELSTEQEIDRLVDKLAEDFKKRLHKLVERHTKKQLREQSSQLKTINTASSARAPKTKKEPIVKPARSSKRPTVQDYSSSSDSD